MSSAESWYMRKVTGSSGRGKGPRAGRWGLTTLPPAEPGHIIHRRMRSLLPRTPEHSGFQQAASAGGCILRAARTRSAFTGR
jgi:hypothetical protein